MKTTADYLAEADTGWADPDPVVSVESHARERRLAAFTIPRSGGGVLGSRQDDTGSGGGPDGGVAADWVQPGGEWAQWLTNPEVHRGLLDLPPLQAKKLLTDKQRKWVTACPQPAYSMSVSTGGLFNCCAILSDDW